MSKQKQNAFISDIDVRWCPGCGDYAILKTVQKLLPTLNIEPENTVFISGIGCAGRFPYYLETYGLHGIHGRAPAIVTGLKIKRPELSVWMITGDGDALSIGIGHLLHLMRRNIDVNILLLNNEIYGLTKGQYSPTSPQGVRNKVTLEGAIDMPFNPISLVLSAGCSFVARAIDVDSKNLGKILKAAHAHRGTAFVEILQNCNVFNDLVFADFTERSVRADRTIFLEDNTPMCFGSTQNKGLVLAQNRLKIVDLTKTDREYEPLIHNLNNTDASNCLPDLLAKMTYPEWPVALGIFQANIRPTYDQILSKRTQKTTTTGDLQALLESSSHTWTVF